MPSESNVTETLWVEGYRRARELLANCQTAEGYLASPSEIANYRRVWARDGVILGLAAQMTGDPQLTDGLRTTLETLAAHQGPNGEIPSNVDPLTGRVSYGGTAGRVDADLWFIVGCGEYWYRSEDDAFLDRMLPHMTTALKLLSAWEFNTRGLVYVPQTGDWADEYIQSGYVLYDQLLYLQAQCTLYAITQHLHGEDHQARERLIRLKQLIRDNYWFTEDGTPPEMVYHEILYQRGHEAAEHRAGQYWMPFFAPHGYGFRFDAFANSLVSLLGVADDEQCQRVDRFIENEVAPADLPVLRAFFPAITPQDTHWRDLQMGFSNTFKNQPHHYHNGGLWQMITGFYIADLAQRGQTQRAERHLEAVHRANALGMNGEDAWSFAEYISADELQPGGTQYQGWSAGAAIMGQHALEGERVFRLCYDDVMFGTRECASDEAHADVEPTVTDHPR